MSLRRPRRTAEPSGVGAAKKSPFVKSVNRTIGRSCAQVTPTTPICPRKGIRKFVWSTVSPVVRWLVVVASTTPAAAGAIRVSARLRAAPPGHHGSAEGQRPGVRFPWPIGTKLALPVLAPRPLPWARSPDPSFRSALYRCACLSEDLLRTQGVSGRHEGSLEPSVGRLGPARATSYPRRTRGRRDRSARRVGVDHPRPKEDHELRITA